MTASLPITILAGYLGSGKTTLVNGILTKMHDTKLAVVVNDFGQVNIDARLIAAEGAETVELSNGCVCCSIGDDLGTTLGEIAAWREPPDHVLLEASGIAEPRRIAMTAGHWPGYQLASLIVTADATTIQTRAQDKFVGTLILSQLRSASLIALTKTDLLNANEIESVRAWLTDVTPATRVVTTLNGMTRADLFPGTPHSEPARGPLFSSALPPLFVSACWRPEGPIDVDKLSEFLGALPAQVHRVKGVIADATTGTRRLVQYAGGRLDITPATDTVPLCLVLVSIGSQEELNQLCRQLRSACPAQSQHEIKPPCDQDS